MSELTSLFQKMSEGNADAADRAIRLVYDELRRLAARKLQVELPNQTLQATALVHEAWLRLGAPEKQDWKNRAHFFGAAAEAMRRILIDRARQRRSPRRGGDFARTSLENLDLHAPGEDEQILAINDALEAFALIEPRKAELVKLRYFAGLTFEESALALGIAVPTAKQWWAYARAWLKVAMQRAGPR